MRILIVCSPGGHMAQMERLLDAFSGHDVALVTYHSPRDPEPLPGMRATYLVPSIGTSPIKALKALPTFLWALYRERPQVLISTGSEIAIPFFVFAKLLRMKSLYIESMSRVRTRSATGRVAYLLADRFFVQWETLLDVYGPKAEMRGRVA